jgi:hypothetical protein
MKCSHIDMTGGTKFSSLFLCSLAVSVAKWEPEPKSSPTNIHVYSFYVPPWHTAFLIAAVLFQSRVFPRSLRCAAAAVGFATLNNGQKKVHTVELKKVASRVESRKNCRQCTKVLRPCLIYGRVECASICLIKSPNPVTSPPESVAFK